MKDILTVQKLLKIKRTYMIAVSAIVTSILLITGGLNSSFRELHYYALTIFTFVGGRKIGMFVFLLSFMSFLARDILLRTQFEIIEYVWFAGISVITVFFLDNIKTRFNININEYIEQNKQLNEETKEKEILLNKLETSAEEMKLFYQMSLGLATCRDQDQINKGLIEWVNKAIKCSWAAIYVKEGESIALKNSSSEGAASTFLAEGGYQYISKLVNSNLPVIENSPRFNLLLRNQKVLAELSIEAIIAVPITIKGHNNGVLVLFKDEDIFYQGDMDKLITMANHSATVLEVAILNNEKSGLFYQTLTSLAAAIDAKDSYTKGHSEKVTYYARLIGLELGLSKKQMEALEYASLLHDIGKIGIPDAVLNKPGRLTEEEFQVIKKHPNLSYYIVKDIDFLNETLDGIRYHHERIDGKGYPEGLKGKEIPLIARILSIADAFDAMTSHRVYSRARTVEMSLAELSRSSGTQFDQEIVEVFVKVIKNSEKIVKKDIVI